MALAAFAIVRILGLEWVTPLVPWIAFTPHLAVAALVTALGALAARARVFAAVGLVATLALVACVVPRAIASGPHPDGPVLRVLTVNIFNGLANKEQVVDLVRRERVDVLVLEELTYRGRLTLAAKGLDRLLPHHALAVRPGSNGTGIYSRFPTRWLGVLVGATGHEQVRARIDVPGAGPVRVQAVHTESPKLTFNRAWRRTLRQLPRAGTGGPELLAGDFNATLDHAELRRVLRHGWADAADRAGNGLIGTWPSQLAPLPTVTLDHVLVSRGIGVRDTAVYGVGHSDHRGVLAVLELPAA